MSGAQHRVSRAIVRCGEEIGVDPGTTVGIVTLLHPEAARKYLTDAEIAAAPRPLYAIVLRHDDGAVAKTEIEVNGTTLIIEKLIERRLRDVTIYKLAIAY